MKKWLARLVLRRTTAEISKTKAGTWITVTAGSGVVLKVVALLADQGFDVEPALVAAVITTLLGWGLRAVGLRDLAAEPEPTEE